MCHLLPINIQKVVARGEIKAEEMHRGFKAELEAAAANRAVFFVV